MTVRARVLIRLPARIVGAGGTTVTLANGIYTIETGAAVSDGDKGDITVSGDGAVFTIDSDVISTFGRTLTDDTSAIVARSTLGLGDLAILNTVPPAGADTQIQYNDGGILGGDVDFTWDKTNNVLTVAGKLGITGAVGSQPVINAAMTWNNGAFEFTGWKLDITNTASLASSKLLDLQVGAASKFNVLWSGIFGQVALTVGTLPAAGTAGRRAFVTDANATTFASIVAAGGANGVPVYDDGTNWRIG